MADVVLEITIPEAKVEYAREALLAKYPKDDQGLTDKEHIENIIKAYLVNAISGYWKEKAVKEAANNFVEDSDVIT